MIALIHTHPFTIVQPFGYKNAFSVRMNTTKGFGGHAKSPNRIGRTSFFHFPKHSTRRHCCAHLFLEMNGYYSNSSQVFLLCSSCGMTRPLTSFSHPLSPTLLPYCKECRDRQERRILFLFVCYGIGSEMAVTKCSLQNLASSSTNGQQTKRLRGIASVPQARCKSVKRAHLALRKAYVARLVFHRTIH